MTYDGLYWYTYDAWNRLAKVQVAYRAAGDDPEKKHTIATIEYDGLGRRIEKAITNCGNWEATYHYYYYYDGHSLIETQNGSDDTLKSRFIGRVRSISTSWCGWAITGALGYHMLKRGSLRERVKHRN